MSLLNKPPAVLALEDGTVYYGYAFGAAGKAVGEIVFNTAMTGYQEILTDPSYHGQIVTMTYPHIGNYGVSVYDMESNKPFAKGFIVREVSRVASSHRSNQDLQSFMAQHSIVGIEGIDTRALTRRLRSGGVVKGVIYHGQVDEALAQTLVAEAKNHEDIDGRDMTPEVTTPLPYARPTFVKRPRVAVIDFGIKHSIVYKLEQAGAEVIVVPAQTTPRTGDGAQSLRAGHLQRSRRPGRSQVRPRHGVAAFGLTPDLRHLPRASALGLSRRR